MNRRTNSPQTRLKSSRHHHAQCSRTCEPSELATQSSFQPTREKSHGPGRWKSRQQERNFEPWRRVLELPHLYLDWPLLAFRGRSTPALPCLSIPPTPFSNPQEHVKRVPSARRVAHLRTERPILPRETLTGPQAHTVAEKAA